MTLPGRRAPDVLPVDGAVLLAGDSPRLLALGMELRHRGLPVPGPVLRAEAVFRAVVAGQHGSPLPRPAPSASGSAGSTHGDRHEDTGDTAARWGCSDRRVRQLAAAGRIPGARRGPDGRWLIPSGLDRADV